MKAKKKICPTCGKLKFLWNRKVGCQDCVRVSKQPQLKKSELSNRSEKRKGEEAEYRKAKREYLEDHPICEMDGCCKPSEIIHHKKHREGKRIYDKRYFMALCGGFEPCHKYIHANPEESYAKGWLIKG